MTVYLEHLPCTSCRKETVHLRRGMNHAFHLVGALATMGIWCIGWILVAMSQNRTSYCIHCDSSRYTEAPFGWGAPAAKEAAREAEVESPRVSQSEGGNA